MLTCPLPLAKALLRRDARLARLRFRLVPGRITEEAFWHQYMQQLILRVVNHVQEGNEQIYAPVFRVPEQS